MTPPNNERIILANYDNIQDANQNANILRNEGISCTIEACNSPEPGGNISPEDKKFILMILRKDEFFARIILRSDDPWCYPEMQTPVSQQYRLIGAMMTFVGLLCTYASFDYSFNRYFWIPMCMVAVGVSIFVKGVSLESK